MATKKKPPRDATLEDLLSSGLRYSPLEDAPTPATGEPAKGSGFVRRLGDYGLSALKGAIAVPEAAVGMADLVSGGRVGKFLENEGGAVGFRPAQARAVLDEAYSPEQQEANRQVQQADGVLDTTLAAVRNPSVVAHSVVESLPLMLGGGVIARSLMKAAPAIGPVAAGAAGEGLASMGSTAEQVRQQSGDGLLTPQQALLAGGSGAATGLLGYLGGKVAQRLGIADVDTLIAGKAAPEVSKGFVRRVLEGAFSEGILEELPQSVQEQVAQNLALDRPLDEGVDQAAVLGTLAGGVMGGGSQLLARSPGDEIRQQKLPAAGPMTRAVNAPIEETAKAADAAPPVPPAAPPGAAMAQAGITAMLDEERRRAASEARSEELFNQTYPGVAAAPAAEPAMPVPAMRPDALDHLDRMRAADEQSLRVFEPTAPIAATPEPGDLLNPKDEPFRNKRAATQAQKKAGDGFEVLPVAGGYVVRKKKEAGDGGQPVEAAGLAAPADGGGGDDAGRGAGDLGGVAADDGRPVAAAAAEPVAGGEPTAPVGDAGEPDAALTETNDAQQRSRPLDASTDIADLQVVGQDEAQAAIQVGGDAAGVGRVQGVPDRHGGASEPGARSTPAGSEQAVQQGKLRVGDAARVAEDSARGERNAALQSVEAGQAPVQRPEREELRGPRDQDVPAVGGRLPDVQSSGRGEANADSHLGPNRQQPGLRAGQRSMGDEAGTSEQPSQERDGDARRENAVGGAVGAGDRNTGNDPAAPNRGERPVAGDRSGEVTEHVTGRGKVIRGVWRDDFTEAQAKAIDPYSFNAKGKGWFIREKHLDTLPPVGEPKRDLSGVPNPRADESPRARRERRIAEKRDQNAAAPAPEPGRAAPEAPAAPRSAEPAAAAPAQEPAPAPAPRQAQTVAEREAQARQIGKQAFADGINRIPPEAFTSAEKKAWLGGWDAANIAAPVASTEPAPAPDVLTMPDDRIAALAGRQISIELVTGGGKKAEMTLDAAQAVRDMRKRFEAAQELSRCLR